MRMCTVLLFIYYYYFFFLWGGVGTYIIGTSISDFLMVGI